MLLVCTACTPAELSLSHDVGRQFRLAIAVLHLPNRLGNLQSCNALRLLMQVLPGSSLLAEMDDALAKTDYRNYDSVNKLGGFSKLCKSLENHYNLDYIIVDLSPGTTALNRTVIMR